MKRTVGLLVAVLVGLVALMGCGEGSSATLDGSKWKLDGWSVSSLDPADFEITAAFTADKIAGKSAVNQYNGPYVANESGQFSVGPLATTSMAGPEEAMRAETIYLTLLGQARHFEMSSSKLTLSDENGNELLIYRTAD